jgi:hypothetical protein
MHKYLDIVIVLNHVWIQSLGCLHFTLAGMTNDSEAFSMEMSAPLSVIRNLPIDTHSAGDLLGNKT